MKPLKPWTLAPESSSRFVTAYLLGLRRRLLKVNLWLLESRLGNDPL